jgi:Rod binding domain-containing protein
MDKIQTLQMMDPAGAAAQAQTQNSAERAKKLASQPITSEKELDKAAGGFEALMLQEMLKSMWSTVQHSDFMGGDSMEAGIYRDMLSQAIADTVSEGRGIGLKEFMRRELLKAEGQPNAGGDETGSNISMLDTKKASLAKE